MLPNFLTPYLLYIKIGLVVAAMAGASYVTFALVDAKAERDQKKAVDSAVRDVQAQYDAEHKLRVKFESLVDDRLGELATAIAGIQVVNRVITNNIIRERAADPKFYQQPLPDEGYNQWKAARAQATGLPASSPAP